MRRFDGVGEPHPLRLDAQVRAERLDQPDRHLHERAVGLELALVQGEHLVVVRSPPVALGNGLQVLLPPPIVGEADRGVGGLTVVLLRHRHGDGQERGAVRGLDPVPCAEALAARELHRVQVHEHVAAGDLVEVAGPGEVVRLVDRHRAGIAHGYDRPLRNPASSSAKRALSASRSVYVRKGKAAGGCERIAISPPYVSAARDETRRRTSAGSPHSSS